MTGLRLMFQLKQFNIQRSVQFVSVIWIKNISHKLSVPFEGWCFGLVFSHRTWVTCSHEVDTEKKTKLQCVLSYCERVPNCIFLSVSRGFTSVYLCSANLQPILSQSIVHQVRYKFNQSIQFQLCYQTFTCSMLKNTNY